MTHELSGPYRHTRRRYPTSFLCWLLLILTAFQAYMLFDGQMMALNADIGRIRPLTLHPNGPNEPTSVLPDPCALNDVECPEEAFQTKLAAGREVLATIYTYQPLPEQTDGDPCRTASGLNICDPVLGPIFVPFGVVANNCLPFGTEVWIREEQYFVHDRMNDRFNCDYFDILIPTTATPWTWYDETVTVVENA